MSFEKKIYLGVLSLVLSCVMISSSSIANPLTCTPDNYLIYRVNNFNNNYIQYSSYNSTAPCTLWVYSERTVQGIHMTIIWNSSELQFQGVDFSPWNSNHPNNGAGSYTLRDSGTVHVEITNIGNPPILSPIEPVAILQLKAKCFGDTSAVSYTDLCGTDGSYLVSGGTLYGPLFQNGWVKMNNIPHALSPLDDSSLASYPQPESTAKDTAKVAVEFTCDVQADSFIARYEYPRDSLDAITVVRDVASGVIGSDQHFTEDRSGSTAKLRITYSGQVNSTSTPKKIYWIYFRNIMDANYSKASVIRKTDSLRICDGTNSDLYSIISIPDTGTVTTYYKAGMKFHRTEAQKFRLNIDFPVMLYNNFWVQLKGQDTCTTFRIDDTSWDTDIVEYSSYEFLFDEKWRWYDMGGAGNKRFSNHQNSPQNIDTDLSHRDIMNTIVNAGTTADSQVTNILSNGTKLKDLYSNITITSSSGITLESAYFVVKQDTGGGGGGGCPFVYVWNGSQFEEDNTILGASELNPEKPITDYYLLSKPLVPSGDKYRLQIREFENEVSYIDRVKLVTVDHSPKFNVAVSPDGKIFAYDKEFVPTSCIDQNGRDHLLEINNKDGVYFVSEEPGYLMLDYSKRTVGPPILYDPPPDSDGFGTNGLPPPQKKPGVTSTLTVEVQDVQGEWHNLGNVPPRFYPDRSLWLLDDQGVELGDEFKVKISWDKYYAADELKYYIISEEEPIKMWSRPISSINSEGGEILKELSNTDEEYATLMPGQTIELSFPVGSSTEPGMVRDFVLQTVGYYVSLSKPTALPKSYALLNNYPNPFNANTLILYNLPKDSDVKLEIYNILGQKVRTLVDQHQSAGYKNVTWDGRNDKGENVSSGIYFYKFKTQEFSDSKKMLLMK